MEENPSPTVLEGKITGINFSLATRQEICLSSISDCPISHASQLSNPFLGLPLEAGRCESCGTAEPGKCEGHFGYIELPIPIYHPAHIGELKRILTLICLKCLKFKNRKFQTKNAGVLERAFASCCEDAAQVTIKEDKTSDGAYYLELKLPSRSKFRDDWSFLDRYGFRYGEGNSRRLLPSEVLVMLKKMPEATKKKLAGRGCYLQEGYIMQHLPVPPNCLSTPDVSDGISIMSSDISMTMLKKVLRQVEIIKSSRSGMPNFESLEVEVNDLQAAVAQYLQARGAKASPNKNTRYGIAKEINDSSSTKAWLEKMKTLFISKGSGFSSRSVITGDAFKGVGEIGIPFEIAQRITFEERVNEHNVNFLQKLVDDKLCLTYRDGHSTYSLREGSKGHTFLKPGQIVHRKIMEGDVIFINRPPTTHKHSLQALSVYIHDDHTFKINPLICGPLSADFDGDCIHIFYPQSPEAKAEVLELFAVEKQLLSSHSGNVNLQLGSDSLLSLKTMLRKYFFNKAQIQQLALFTSHPLPKPSMLKARQSGPLWTVMELLETSLPRGFDCSGDRFLIHDSKILKLDYSRDVIQSIINEVISSIFFTKGPNDVLKLFNSLQPMLMENLCCEGFNLSLEDFIVPKEVLRSIESDIQDFSSLLYHLRSNYNEVIALQLEKHLRVVKGPILEFILKYSSMGDLIDSKSDSALTRIVQQIGFLGLQIMDKGKLYSRTLAEDLATHFLGNYPFPEKYPSEEFGLVRSCLFHGLDPYQEMVHSIASREVMVRSSRGLTEPGTLFKNLMAILRDVVICYDGTVRNVCSNSIIQFEYGVKMESMFAAGEPVGVLAATAMSNPAYKAVLDSSANSNSSWDMMKEILLCGVNFKNVHNDRRVILYLNDCDCGKKYCLENSAFLVKNHLRKVSLKDVAVEFLIEYRRQQVAYDDAEVDAGLVGHVHLNKTLLKESNISMEEVLMKCEEMLSSFGKKKKTGQLFKKIAVSCSECSFQQSSESKWMPCLQFVWKDNSNIIHLERKAHVFADRVCPVLLGTIIKGDPRVKEANIIWISPEMTAWIRNPRKDQKGELAIDVILEKDAVKKTGDAWRTVMDSCLPVIHLIDTTRSIPYAIKQVENLLGISCAFEQAVQRLSTSVSMVSKGMLKEHLLLLANSMTCAGNLVGFNQAGIKALSKTLNFQVPFSEATLYTPKRCFEKAAEKCHADSLSSIVAACSWGKPVAVGTGSRFDILWDTREVELNQKDGIDVYDFLHSVCGVAEEEADSGRLGDEVDSFDLEDAYMETGSPELDSGAAKPVFEDGLELDIDDGLDSTPGWGSSGGGWGGAATKTPVNEESGGWGAPKADKKEESGGWGAAKADKKDESGGWGGAKVDKKDEPGGWGATKSDKQEESSGWGAAKADETGGWGASKSDKEEPSGWGASKSDKREESSGWGAAKADKKDESGGWGATKSDKREESSGWGAAKADKKDESGGWGATKSDKKHESSGWGATKSDKKEESSGWGTSNSDKKHESGGWGATKSDKKEESSGWGATKSDKKEESSGWGATKSDKKEESSGWGATNSDKKDESGGWGATRSDKKEASSWGATKSDKKEESGGWGTAKSDRKDTEIGWGGKKPEKDGESGSSTAWGKKSSQAPAVGAEFPEDSSKSDRWGTKESWKSQSQPSASWGKAAEKSGKPNWGKKDNTRGGETGWNTNSGQSPAAGAETPVEDSWGAKAGGSTGSWGNKTVEKTNATPSWNKPEKLKVDVASDSDGSGWGKKVEQKADDAGSKDGWGAAPWGKKEKAKDSTEPASNADGSSEKGNEEGEKTGGWGWNRKTEPKPDQGGWKKKEGWGPSGGGGDWKNKRERPARPAGGPNDGPRGGPFTATRQRLDIFTADEQEILTDIEPIMLSIRRIMHQSGYNDGDPLTAEDQTYIIDNVFNHHPEKAQKMGSGIDYITVMKHTKFQDSRCLFVVSTDGRKEDFSYRKCLENYVRVKYPDKVEEFMPKYLKKPQPRPPRAPDEAGTPRSQPGWKRESSAAPDEAGTPRSQSGWRRNSDESGTPRSQSGWKRDSDEAGTPRSQSGWKRDSDEAGTPQSQSGWKRESDEAGGTPQSQTGWNREPADEAGTPAATSAPEEGGWGRAGGSGKTVEQSGWGK